jgi:hypothetical protein
LIFECQAFASVRTSVAMVVGMEVRVVGHNTVRQSAQRLGLFFRGMYIGLPNRETDRSCTGGADRLNATRQIRIGPRDRLSFLCPRPDVSAPAVVGRAPHSDAATPSEPKKTRPRPGGGCALVLPSGVQISRFNIRRRSPLLEWPDDARVPGPSVASVSRPPCRPLSWHQSRNSLSSVIGRSRTRLPVA